MNGLEGSGQGLFVSSIRVEQKGPYCSVIAMNEEYWYQLIIKNMGLDPKKSSHS